MLFRTSAIPAVLFAMTAVPAAGRLRAVLPGQPAYTIAPTGPASFRLTGIPIEVTIEFAESGGRITGLVLTPRGMRFELERR